MKRMICALILVSFPLMMKGADNPELIEENEEDVQQYCVANNYNNCITNICVTSEDINCSSNCQADAVNICNPEAQQ